MTDDPQYAIETLEDLTEALRAIGTYADDLERRLTTANPQGPMVRKAITQGALDDAITYVMAKQREAGARLEAIDETASDSLRVKVGALARIETLRDVIRWLEGLRDGDLHVEDVNRIESPLPTPETHPIAPMQPVGAAEYGAPPILRPTHPTRGQGVQRFLRDPVGAGPWTSEDLMQVAQYVEDLERALDLEGEAYALATDRRRPQSAPWDYAADAHAERADLARALQSARTRTTIGAPFVTPRDVPCPVCGADTQDVCRAEV